MSFCSCRWWEVAASLGVCLDETFSKHLTSQQRDLTERFPTPLLSAVWPRDCIAHSLQTRICISITLCWTQLSYILYTRDPNLHAMYYIIYYFQVYCFSSPPFIICTCALLLKETSGLVHTYWGIFTNTDFWSGFAFHSHANRFLVYQNWAFWKLYPGFTGLSVLCVFLCAMMAELTRIKQC